MSWGKTVISRRVPLPMDGDHGRRAASTVVATVVLGVVMVALGSLVTHQFAQVWPLSAEDTVDRTLAAHRDAFLNTLTGALCTIADTPCTVVLAIVAILSARWICHRWRDALLIAVAVAIEVSVFLVTTVLVHRARPGVVELDHSPPTSSFPSGHTAAAVALYGAIAWLIVRHTGRAYAWCLLLMPAAVGFARLYRGMHHPSDVAAGLLLGAGSLLIARYAVFGPRAHRARQLAHAQPSWRWAGSTALGGRR